MIVHTQPTKPNPTQPTLIDDRMKLFLGRQLHDILDHLPNHTEGETRKRTLKALQKLQNNNFGTCEKCDLPINIGRILTDPAAQICACCEHGLDCPVGHPLHQD